MDPNRNDETSGPSPRRCEECNAEMGPGAGEYAVCRDGRLGPPDASLERDMTGVGSR